MTTADVGTAVTTLHEADCLRLLAGDSVGRLGVIAGGAPHIIPVNYVLDEGTIVFRTSPGTKFDAAERAPACFEVDSFDRERRSGWSVVAHGRLEEVTQYDGKTFRHLATLDVEPWADGAKENVLRLVPSYFTGRKLQGTE